MSPKVNKLLLSTGFGLVMMLLFWLTYFVSVPFLDYFIQDANEVDADLAAAVRMSTYTMLLILSPQVWVFSSLYFFDRKRK